ncbi:hypothetical protein QMA71_27535 [Pseudomonas otitidis]|uniref:hypothetical protein n=1 Tax=Metapseudomonas otitidis TaxID=319939 RepID=UPI0024ACD5AD|nr:hypothetical protein [Pseudomonas otitidis]MDI6529303.1 hypothetical protein [Pseudomonas otitidis]
MSVAEVELSFYARPDSFITIEQRHSELMNRLTKFGGPLGFLGLDLPEVPSCGDGLVATYTVKLPTRGLRFIGDYTYRSDRYPHDDLASFDEHLRYGFKISNKFIDYSKILNEDFLAVVEAFCAYKAHASYDLYDFYYQGGLNDDNQVYNELRKDPAVDVDGRNNIYTIYPAQFWDSELCLRALGYGADEVVSRLSNKVKRVERFMHGVYLVLNDDPDLSYEDFLKMNNKIKSELGLV